MSDFRVGDEFEIRVRLTGREPTIGVADSGRSGVASRVEVVSDTDDRVWLWESTLRAAKRIERPIVVGDSVRLDSIALFESRFTVLAIDSEFAWCKDGFDYRSLPLSKLRRA